MADVVPPTRIPHTFEVFTTAGGARVFRLPLQAFPGFYAYAYLAVVDDLRVLIDVGSGFGASNQDLEAGLARAGFGFADLTHVLLTHGHIDHFGGLAYVRERTQAKVGIHELDLRNLTNYEERIVMIERRLRVFLIEAGISEERRAEMMRMYRINKALFRGAPVDFTFEAAGMRVGPFEFLHVPGHCAGHVIIRLHDVLFSGDHVLDVISPHQSPERLTLYTGLGHYLASLEALRAWGGSAALTLCGHNDPIRNLPARLDAIRAVHAERLRLVLDILAEPGTIGDVSRALFGRVSGYDVLLAVEEAGAHVEYLYQRGLLRIVNVAELEAGDGPLPIRYQRMEDPVAALLLG